MKKHNNHNMIGRSFFVGGIVGIMTVLLFTSCARMGQPDGGWYDETPPRILSSSPADGSVDVSSKRISINFDEFIKLDNPTEKVVVSPPQHETPEIKSGGKHITVELKDSLKANTTYTIDFSDAISDNNENNPLGNYTYTFSTGDHIDTMQVAGYVLEAEDMEPIKGILVGLYSDLSDSAFSTKPLLRVSHTDDNGHFAIKGVAAGQYRIYALQDMDDNYMFSQKGEKLAFSNDIINPSWKPDVRKDTLWSDTLHIKSISQTPYTHFLPDDVVLRAFTEKQTDRYFLKAERKNAECFSLFFSYGNGEMPVVQGLNFNASDAFIIEPSQQCDTVTYWLRDTALVNQDTLRMSIQYHGTDSLGQLRLQTDTLEVLSKDSYAKRMKKQKEDYEKWEKQQQKRKKAGRSYEEVRVPEALEPKYNVSSTVDPDGRITIEMPCPLSVANTTRIHLYSKIDTLWYRSVIHLDSIPGRMRSFVLSANWRPGTEYSLEIDSAAFTDIYGKASKAYKQGFRVGATDAYGSLEIDVVGMSNKHCIVEMLGSNGSVVKSVRTVEGIAHFDYVKPSAYYVRLIEDDNDNGIWDTGEYAAKRQAEALYYYPKEIECRAKWDIRETWDPLSVPLYRQKPVRLVKQKSQKKQKQRVGRNAQRAHDMGIEYIAGQTK